MTRSDPTNDQTVSSGVGEGINLGAVNCPCCHQPMPALRIPTGVHRMMWGGFICPSCATQLDKWGEPVGAQATG